MVKGGRSLFELCCIIKANPVLQIQTNTNVELHKWEKHTHTAYHIMYAEQCCMWFEVNATEMRGQQWRTVAEIDKN